MKEFTFKPFIQEAVRELGFHSPTKIQEEIMPLVLKGRSAIGQSKTGSGKTHSFLLPIFEKLSPEKEELQAIILAPTRELADQIFQAAQQINKHSENAFLIRNYTGGTDKKKAIEQLKRQPHLVIGTPGRVHDLVREEALNVFPATMLVIDEADLTFDMGFLTDVDQVASRMAKELEMFVFSATIPEKLQPFLKKYMENPVHIKFQSNAPTVEEITQYLVQKKSKSRIDTLVEIMSVINPFLGMIFANTRKNAEEVATQLAERGIKVGRIHGDLNPRERKKMMKQIRDLEYQYIVATDLAARGIDIEGVSHVINYELPDDLDFYVHRVGRTARAGTSGIAMTIVDHADEKKLVALENRGIPLGIAEVKNGEIVEVGKRNRRKTRKKASTDVDVMVTKMIKKPGKVKPNYKRKLQEERDQLKRKKTGKPKRR